MRILRGLVKSKCVLLAFGLAVAIAFAQSSPEEGEERLRADVHSQEWLDRACVDACCLVAWDAARLLYQERDRSRAEVYALEGLGALGGATSCGLGGGMVWLMCVFGNTTEQPNFFPGGAAAARVAGLATAVVSAAVLPAVAGYGTIRAGERLGEDGSKGWAIAGAYAGAAVGTGLGFLGYYVGSRTSDWVGIPFYVVGGLAIPTGAVIGYNLGTRRGSEPFQPGLGGRLQSPGVALMSVELPDHSVEYGVKLQLAGLRF